MKNQKGHVLIVTILFSFFFIAILNHQINMYILEKKHSKATEKLYQLENLMQVTAVELVRETASNTSKSGKVVYPFGSVTYTVTPLTTVTSSMSITCLTKSGGEFKAKFIYDFSLKKMTKWEDIRY